MVNPLNGSGSSQTTIANPFQQRQTHNDAQQTDNTAKSGKTGPAPDAQQQNSSQQTAQSTQVAQNNNNAKSQANAGRGQLVDITT